MNKSMWVAIFLSLGLFLWVISGPDDSLESTNQHTEERVPMKVQVTESLAVDFDIDIKFQCELLPAREVILRSETEGRVAEIIVDKASSVNQGVQILSIALDDRKARLEGAKAELIKAESDLVSNRKLYKRGLLSASQLKQNESNFASAKAQLSQINNEINNTKIKAPFDSVVDDRFVEVGDYVREGDSLVRVLDTKTLKVIGWVPQQKASELEVGQKVSTELVNGRELTGVISYVAPQADIETRAFKIEAEIKPVEKVKLLGSSVSSRIITSTKKAHFLSPSVISLDASGALLVKAVNEDNKVVSYPIEVIQSESNGIWLLGLPDVVNVITMGQGFVLPDQIVEPTLVTDKNGTELSESPAEQSKREA